MFIRFRRTSGMVQNYPRQKHLRQHRYYLRHNPVSTEQSFWSHLHWLTSTPLRTITTMQYSSTPTSSNTSVAWSSWSPWFSNTYTVFYSSKLYTCFTPPQTPYRCEPQWHFLVSPPFILNPIVAYITTLPSFKAPLLSIAWPIVTPSVLQLLLWRPNIHLMRTSLPCRCWSLHEQPRQHKKTFVTAASEAIPIYIIPCGPQRHSKNLFIGLPPPTVCDDNKPSTHILRELRT